VSSGQNAAFFVAKRTLTYNAAKLWHSENTHGRQIGVARARGSITASDGDWDGSA
jgi:hypothetical protein